MLMFVAMAVHGFKLHTISSQRSIHVFWVSTMFAAGLLYNGIPPFNIAHKKAAATSMPLRPASAVLSGPESGSDSDSEVTTMPQRRKLGGESGMGDPAQKRRLVGEREEPEGELAVAAPSPPRFRHLGHVRQTRAACLMFCFKELLRSAQDSDDGVTLAALPPELVELIVRHCVSGSAVVRFTRPEALECVATLRGHDSQISVLEHFACADGVQILASGDVNGSVKLWDLSSRECVATLGGHTDLIHCLTSFVDANGVTWLASGSDDSTIILWDVVAHTEAQLSGHTDGVCALAVYRNAPGLACLASGSYVCSIKLWDMRTYTAIATLRMDVVSLCVFSDAHGCDFLVSGGRDGSIKVWDLATHKTLFALREHPTIVRSLLCFSNENGVPMLVSASDDQTVKVWDLECRVAVKTLDCGPIPDSLVCVAGLDGRVMLAYTSAETSGKTEMGTVIDLSTGRRVFQVPLADSFAFDTFVERVSGVPFLAVCGEEGEADVIQLYTDPGGV
jgi:WD40 repeat protein